MRWPAGSRRGTWAALHDPAAHAPLTNRALQGLYAPGSTFKPVTALAALGAGLITPATVVDDRGTYRLGSRGLQNAQGRAHGKVDLARALAVSSDVYFYGLGTGSARGPGGHRRRRPDPGRRRPARVRPRQTGIDIGPEAAGRVPGPASRREAHDRRPAAVPDGGWYPGDNVNLSIGQGDCSSPRSSWPGPTPPWPPVWCRPPPTSSGRPAPAAGPARPSAGLDPGARMAVLAGLQRAVGTREGTAAAAFAGFPLDRVPVVGKTGTAQVTGKADTSLFAAVAPADDPALRRRRRRRGGRLRLDGRRPDRPPGPRGPDRRPAPPPPPAGAQ